MVLILLFLPVLLTRREIRSKLRRIDDPLGTSLAVADQGGGAVWGNFPPKRLWRPFDTNAPLFGA